MDLGFGGGLENNKAITGWWVPLYVVEGRSTGGEGEEVGWKGI